MPYPLLLEDLNRINRRHRRREELLECFRLLREGDANNRELSGTPHLLGLREQMLSTDQRPPLVELYGIVNIHRQQEMVPPKEHCSNTNTSLVNTTDSTMQQDAKRQRLEFDPSIVAKSTTQHGIHLATTRTPSEHTAKKRCVTFAPTIATYSTLLQQYEHESDHKRERPMDRRNMTENNFETAYSRYPRMRASSLALPDHHFAQSNNARDPLGVLATLPTGNSFRVGSASQRKPFYMTRLPSDFSQPLSYSANPRMYSFSIGRGKPASLLPPHPLGNRAAVAVVPPTTNGTKRRAL
jgi:hypothetical protein